MSVDTTDVDDPDTGLSSNVARDLVHYVRSSTIRNEQQFLLATLGYISGYQDDPEHFISGVLIGTSSSGKSHLKRKIDSLFPEDDLYHTSSGTEKSMIYDEEWDESNIVSMEELQQPPEALIEFLKAVHGGDEKFEYKTTQGSVRDGFETKTITKESKPYWFTYARLDADFEMWNRLLSIPVHESESKNRAVGAMSFDHHHIEIGDDDVEYGFDYGRGTKQIQEHIIDIRDRAPGHVVLPNGGDEFDWDVWSVVEPIFNHSRSEVNRVYTMVANLIRASALLNFKDRQLEEIHLSDQGTVDAIIAEPQDVANVLACREALLATTHEIDKKKRAICTAIDVKSGNANEIEGVNPILEYLTESDAPEVKKSELESILEDLQDNYLINIHEGAGESGDDIYEFLGWDELGFARVKEHGDLFDSSFDPITGQPFTDSHEEMRERLDTDASELMSQAASVSSQGGVSGRSKPASAGSSSSVTEDGNTGLDAFGAGNDPMDDVTLTPVEETVMDFATSLLDGERIEDLTEVPVEAFVGLVPIDQPDKPRKDPDGTLLDPDHSLWTQPDKPDDWVQSEQDARREIKMAVKSLIDNRVIRFETIHEKRDGEPVDATLAVVPPS